MARRLVQRAASQEEINGGSFDSVMSLQTYLGEDTFPDIPEVQENHGEALERSTFPPAFSKLLHGVIWIFALLATFASIWGTTTDIFRLACFINSHLALPAYFANNYGSFPLNISALCKAAGADGPEGFRRYLDDNLSTISTRFDNLEAQIASLPLRRNFALRGGGAAIIPEYTSPTFRLPPRSYKSSFLAWLRGIDIMNADINLPLVLLEGSLKIGDCWEFQGDTGHVGIALPVRVQISEIAVSYISAALVSPQAIRRAPKNLTLWGLMDGSDGAYVSGDPNQRSALSFTQSNLLPSTAHTMDYFIALGSINYNITALPLLQTYPISGHGLTFKIIVVEVKENWGADTTCLYTFGVYGIGYDEC